MTPSLIESKIKQETSLINGSELFYLWQKPPFPTKFNIYVFNITNPDDVQIGKLPIIKELGPYVYDQYWEHVNITMDEENDTISYYIKKVFYFNEKESGDRKLNDSVTLINSPLITTVDKINRTFSYFLFLVNNAVPFLFQNATDIFLRGSIREFFFDGIVVNCTSSEVALICSNIAMENAPKIRPHPNGKDFLYSLFSDLNTTLDGPYVSYRGFKNNSRGQIISYKNQSKLDIWNDDECNSIAGTDSSIYGNLLEGKKIYTFNSAICKSMGADYEKNHETFGINTYRYSITNESLKEMKSINESDSCFIDGLYDLSPCMKSPIYMSLPHFYLGNENYSKAISGLNPKKKLHESFAEIEPITGIPLTGAKRMQLNMFIEKCTAVDLLANVTNFLVPIVWIDENVNVPEAALKNLRTKLKIINYVEIGRWVILALGCVFLVVVIFLITSRVLVYNLESADRKSKEKASSETLSTNTNVSTVSVNVHEAST